MVRTVTHGQIWISPHLQHPLMLSDNNEMAISNKNLRRPNHSSTHTPNTNGDMAKKLVTLYLLKPGIQGFRGF